MKCDDCLNLLETYLDGEAGEHDTELVRTHLMTCSGCASEFEALSAENELYARYDRDLQISPAVWNGIAARIAPETPVTEVRERRDVRGWFAGLFVVPRLGFAFSGAMAVLIAMVAAGYFLLMTPDQPVYRASSGVLTPSGLTINGGAQAPEGTIPLVGRENVLANPEKSPRVGPELT